jgi:hypothetical protein
MQQDQVVTDAVEIIDDALADLEACGCEPLDSAAALIAAGLAELRDSDAPPAEELALYRSLLGHMLEALERLQERVPATRKH